MFVASPLVTASQFSGNPLDNATFCQKDGQQITNETRNPEYIPHWIQASDIDENIHLYSDDAHDAHALF